jgi:hypothetical protein
MMEDEAGLQESFELPSTAILLDSSKSVYMRLCSAANSNHKHISMFIRQGKVGVASEAEEVSELRRRLQKDIIIRTIVYDGSNFLHISIKILAGRAVEVRQKLASQSFEFVNNFYKNLKLSQKRCDISIDIIEMNRETYQKITLKK